MTVNLCPNVPLEMLSVDSPPKIELPAPYAVFQKIRELASDSEAWGKLLRSVNEEIPYAHETEEMLPTSCVANMHLLNHIFVGEKQASKILDILGFSSTESASFIDPKTKNINWWFIHNVLSGNRVIELNTKFQDTSYKYKKNEAMASQDQSKEYTVPLKLFIDKFQKIYDDKKVESSIYDFNHNVINTLEAEIIENGSKVDDKTSFIYHVAIVQPNYKAVESAPQSAVLNNPVEFYHAFILEHYYNPEANRDFLRFHNAFKSKYRLDEHYERKNYDDRDQGCMNQVEAKIWCDNLRGMLSGDERPNYANLRKNMFACFGVDAHVELPGLCRKDKVFTGRSIRYLTSKINPKDCLCNIQDLRIKYKV